MKAQYPMTLRWFRDSIGTVYIWDYINQYFYTQDNHPFLR